MNFTPIAAFGSVIVLSTADAGDTLEVTSDKDTYFYTNGSTSASIKETGEVLGDRTPGWLNSEQSLTTGTTLLSFTEHTEWVHIPYNINKAAGIPNVASLVVPLGDNVTLANSSNVYLVSGQFEINSRVFTGPTLIRVRSGDVIANNISTGSNYALLFE